MTFPAEPPRPAGSAPRTGSAHLTGPARRAPRGFRRWRRTRPFWGGVFAVLGGVELIAIPLAPMPLIVHQGMAGVASWLIGALLVTAGALLWFQPAHRSFYGVLAVLLSLASFLTSNFGGFLVGLLLGVLGGALGFAWSPSPDGPRRRTASRGGGPGTHAAPRGGRLTALAVPALLGVHLLAPSPSPAPSDSSAPTPAPAFAAASTTPSPSPSAPSSAPSSAQTSAPMTPSGSQTPSPQPSTSGTPTPTATPSATPTATPAPAKDAGTGPRLYADTGTLRADSLTMSGLSYDGVASLPSAGGTVKALKFSMSKAVLKNVDQTAVHGGATARSRTGGLTLSGDVVMYTTKMSAKLLGVPVTFTPATPPPLTPPYMVLTDVVSEQPAVTAGGAQISGLAAGGAG
ncbi:DUF6114 domain-containing protein [Actinomadura sp. K4S16]|uniref:DUF6114 domain-containing protein n=1 Tax=Actinomadura sp. K4S16 TaxID=1316147 RepID=UPI00135AD40D|nr:DUF6114 domain-containing protein [Actinomadura sp. K4S16]